MTIESVSVAWAHPQGTVVIITGAGSGIGPAT